MSCDLRKYLWIYLCPDHAIIKTNKHWHRFCSLGLRASLIGTKSCDEKLTPQLLFSKMLLHRPYREHRKSCVFRVFFVLSVAFYSIGVLQYFLADFTYIHQSHAGNTFSVIHHLFSLILRRVTLRRTRRSVADS